MLFSTMEYETYLRRYARAENSAPFLWDEGRCVQLVDNVLNRTTHTHITTVLRAARRMQVARTDRSRSVAAAQRRESSGATRSRLASRWP